MAETTTQLGAFNASPTAPAILDQQTRKLNGRDRRVQRMPKAISELSEKTKVYIFNIGPWKHTQLCGSLGSFLIRACEEGHEFSEPTVIPGIVSEHYPLREGALDLIMDEDSDGWNQAHEIIGVGKHLAPSNSLVKYGVGVSRVWPPAKEDLVTAKTALYAHLAALVDEANVADAAGPRERENVIRPDQHFVAARILKKTVAECPWMNRATEQVGERIACPFCGVSVAATIPKCPNCKEVINQAEYDKAKAIAKGK